MVVADECTGKESGFAEDLEAVATAEDETTVIGEVFDGTHDGRVGSYGPAAKVVAVGEAAGEEDGVEAVDRGLSVPDVFSLVTEDVGDCVVHVAFGPRAREYDDAEFH